MRSKQLALAIEIVVFVDAMVSAQGVAIAAADGHTPETEIRPLETLDIELGGEAVFLAPFGGLEEKLGETSKSHGFVTDTTIWLAIDAEDEATDLSYGTYVELEAANDLLDDPDTATAPFSASEAWVYVNGSFGELRFGDVEAVSEDMALGGFTIATGSGGTDGDIIDTPEVNYLTSAGTSTKIIYYSPEISGFQLGVDYAPEDDEGLEDFLEVGLAYTGSLGEVDLLASLVGVYGRSDGVDEATDPDASGVMGGVVLYLAEFSVAAGLATEKIAGRDSSWYNLGLAYEAEIVTASVNFGHCFACEHPDDLERDLKAYNLVFGVEVAVAPGLVTSLEISIFDESRFDEDSDLGDSGVLGLSRLAAFF